MSLRACGTHRLAEVSRESSELALLFSPSLDICCWPLSRMLWWPLICPWSHLCVHSQHPAPQQWSFKQTESWGLPETEITKGGGGCKTGMQERWIPGCEPKRSSVRSWNKLVWTFKQLNTDGREALPPGKGEIWGGWEMGQIRAFPSRRSAVPFCFC